MATTENYVLKDGQLVPDESVTTRTNVSKVPNLDIQVKPMITDNIGSDLSTQTSTDIDWNQNLNIINVGGFRGFGKRKALRDALNASKNTLIWNGNGFQRVNTGLGADKWSRRDVRRLMKSYNNNWSTYNNKVPLEGNNANYAAYLSENYLVNNPTATNFRWTAGKYPLQLVEAQLNEILTNDVQEQIKEPSFYGEIRNYLLDLTQKANEDILGLLNKRKDANLAMEFAANKKAYENAINNNNQGSKPQTSATPQLGQIEVQTSKEYIPTRLDYLTLYANIVTNPTNDNIIDRFEARPFNYNERRYIDQDKIYTVQLIDNLVKEKYPNVNLQNPEEYYNYFTKFLSENGLERLPGSYNATYKKNKESEIVNNNIATHKNDGSLTFREMYPLARKSGKWLTEYAEENGYKWDPQKQLYIKLLQGGTMNTQQQDKEEQLLQYALFSIIGANDDIDLNTAVSAIAEAYIKDPQSLTQVIQDEDTIKQGMLKLELENPGSVKQITQPGFMKKVISKLASQKQQGIKQAKMGTKLDYIKQLKNICPEGYEIEFRKAGGRVCPVCKKKHKALKALEGNKIEKECKGGISKAMDGIKADMAKCGGKVKKGLNGLEAKKPLKKQEIHPADTLHSGKQIYDLSGKYKQYPYLTPKRYQQLPQKDKVNADLKDEERGRKKGDEK